MHPKNMTFSVHLGLTLSLAFTEKKLSPSESVTIT
ncbi:unnamed protein product [Haemonchus placei]|uniref:Neur_chan_LBD domain-containing protein n=1 Tax=Haemonchus placei TaxID=6290 RepID=A0A0N4W9L3_HAEPC|nr:unnamed protein product [Haemonchus placei]